MSDRWYYPKKGELPPVGKKVLIKVGKDDYGIDFVLKDEYTGDYFWYNDDNPASVNEVEKWKYIEE